MAKPNKPVTVSFDLSNMKVTDKDDPSYGRGKVVKGVKVSPKSPVKVKNGNGAVVITFVVGKHPASGKAELTAMRYRNPGIYAKAGWYAPDGSHSVPPHVGAGIEFVFQSNKGNKLKIKDLADLATEVDYEYTIEFTIGNSVYVIDPMIKNW